MAWTIVCNGVVKSVKLSKYLDTTLINKLGKTFNSNGVWGSDARISIKWSVFWRAILLLFMFEARVYLKLTSSWSWWKLEMYEGVGEGGWFPLAGGGCAPRLRLLTHLLRFCTWRHRHVTLCLCRHAGGQVVAWLQASTLVYSPVQRSEQHEFYTRFRYLEYWACFVSKTEWNNIICWVRNHRIVKFDN